MFLVQLLLPLYNNANERSPPSLFKKIREEIVAQFGGLTAYTRAPASGLWQEDDGSTVHDEIVIYEVMSDSLDEAWWRIYRAELERRFQQETLVVRVQHIRVL